LQNRVKRLITTPMNRTLIFTLVLLFTASLKAEEQPVEPKFSPEQLQAIQDSMRQPEPAEKPAASPPPAPSINGSRDVADEAYRNKDYETAKKHYEALAKQGDGEASMIVGTMHQDGLGTEKDQAAAHAWYKKAEDTDKDGGAGSLLAEALEKDSMTVEDIAKSEKIYNELNTNKSLEIDPPKASVANSTTASTNTALRTASKRQSTKVRNSFDLSNQVKITPERYRRNVNSQLTKKTNFGHYKPEKYTR
jgi:hypothetical protein